MFDEPNRRLADHDATCWCDRFHPLRHPDVRSERRVTLGTGADLAEHHIAGVQSDTQRNLHTVSSPHLIREGDGLLLYFERGDTCSNSVIFQRNRSPEQSHDAVSGELLDRTAVTLSDGSAPVEKLTHDFTQPLRSQGRGQVHRALDVSEENGDLFVLGLSLDSDDRRSASVTESGAGARLATASPAR